MTETPKKRTQISFTSTGSSEGVLSRVASGIVRAASIGRLRKTTPGIVRRCSIGEIREINNYSILQVLGAGSQGIVFEAVDVDTNIHYAIKAITRPRPKRSLGRPDGDKKAKPNSYDPEMMLDREIAIMKKLDHPNVVKLYEVLEDVESNEIFLVMDFVSGGPVMCEGVDTDPIPELLARKYFRQLISALKYCHSHGVIHCDIKPSNILHNGDIIKVADFGTSRIMGTKRTSSSKSSSSLVDGETEVFMLSDAVSRVLGTTAFLSPQAQTGSIFSGTRHDMWSCGVTLFYFVYGRLPFSGETIVELNDSIRETSLEFPENPKISDSLKELLKGLIEKDESKRMTLHEVLQHDWVTKGGVEPINSQPFRPIEVSDEDCKTAVQQKRKSPNPVIKAVKSFRSRVSEARKSIGRRPSYLFKKRSSLDSEKHSMSERNVIED